MTTLTNEQIVGELGWSLQIMSNLNGGRISRFWRPPYGDVDNRVRAIAKGVFGLETVVWTHDTGDWNLDNGGSYTVDGIVREYNTWLADKTQGINVLEHEVRPSQVDVFRQVYPRAKQLGWDIGNIADTFGLPWYQNAADDESAVVSMGVAGAAPSGGLASESASASASASVSSTSASSMISSMSARSVAPSPTGSLTASQSASSASTTVTAAAQSIAPSNAAARRGVASTGFLMGILGVVTAMML